MNERFIRLAHGVLMTFTFIFAVVTLGVSAYLVAKYDQNGASEYPHHTKAYRDRTRIILTASVWTTFWSMILLVGFQVAGHNAIFGILPHLIPVLIGFVLMMIGAASLTGLTAKINCGNPDQTFERCNTMKGLVAVSWIDAIFLLFVLIFVIAIAFKARAWGGVRRNTLYVD